MLTKNKFLKGLALVLAVMMIMPAILACTDEDARASIEEVKNSMLSEQQVKDIVAEVLAGINTGASVDDVKEAVNAAVKDLPTKADVDKIVDAAVNEAVKDLPTKDDVNAAIKDQTSDLVTKDELEKNETAGADLVAKKVEVRTKIDVIKETYAANKNTFSEADYAKIVTLISTANANVDIATKAEDIDAILTKLQEDLKAYSSYALSIFTQWLALNGTIIANTAEGAADSAADITALINLVKEAVAHYYKADSATTYADLTNYTYGSKADGSAIQINLLNAVGVVVLSGGKVNPTTKANELPVTYSADGGKTTKTFKSLQNQYYLAQDFEKDGAALEKKIVDIGAVSLAADSIAKVNAAQTAYDALYNKYIVAGNLNADGLTAHIANKADLDAANARIIALNKAKDAIKYISVDGKSLLEAYKAFDTADYLTNAKSKFSDEEAAKATELFTALQAWAENAEWSVWVTPEYKKDKRADLAAINSIFESLDASLNDFEANYWGYIVLTKGGNVAYNKMKDRVQEIAAMNERIGDNVAMLDASLRKEISDLANSVISSQKISIPTYNSSKNYYEEKTSQSMGNSATGNLIKAAAAQLGITLSKYVHYNNTSAYASDPTIDNGIKYEGFKTSTSSAQKYLIGFNQAITEFMYSKFGPAEEKFEDFADRADDIVVLTSVSAKVARDLLDEINTFVADKAATDGVDYTADVADTVAVVTQKIEDINAKITNLKSQYDAIKSAVDNINKDKVAKKYDGSSNQTEAQRNQTNTLDKPQIDPAWDLYIAFIAAGGSNDIQTEKANTDAYGEITGYSYSSVVSASIITKLTKYKSLLDASTKKAAEFDEAVDMLNKLHSSIASSFDYTAFYIPTTSDSYYVGYEGVITPASTTVVEGVEVVKPAVTGWVREKNLVETMEAIITALAAFKTENDGEKYKFVEDIKAEALYQTAAFAYVKYLAIEQIKTDANSNDGIKTATVQAIQAAANMDAINAAVKNFNTVVNDGDDLVLNKTMSNFN